MSDLTTIKRVDSVGALPTLTADAMYTNALALVADDGSGAASLRKWNGSAWVAISISGITGGSVTLAGDVTGPSGTNTVVALTGTAGFVAVHGNVIRWDATTSGFRLTQADQSINNPVTDFQVITSAPFASATGANRNAANGLFRHRPPVASGTAGRWAFEVSDAEIFAVESDRIRITGLSTARVATAAALNLEIASGTGSPPGELTLRRGAASPFLTAGGSGGSEFVDIDGNAIIQLNADNIVFRSGAGTVKGNFSATELTLSVASMTFVPALGAVSIIQLPDTGVGATFTLLAQTSTDNFGGNLYLGSGSGGGGFLPGNLTLGTGATTSAITLVASTPQPIVHFHGNTVRWSETSTPFLGQEQRSSDAACHSMTISSQAPYASATGANKLPGNIFYVIPANSDVGDPRGYHSFLVSGDEIVRITTDVVTMNGAILFADAYIGAHGSSPTIGAAQAAADADGSAINIQGQQGGPGLETDGGPIVIIGGPPTGSGVAGEVKLELYDATASIRIMARDEIGHSAIVFNGDAVTVDDLPTNFTRYLFLADSAGSPASPPVGGHAYASVGGIPYWLTGGSHSFSLDNTTRVSAGSSVLGYLDVGIDGAPVCIPYYARA